MTSGRQFLSRRRNKSPKEEFRIYHRQAFLWQEIIKLLWNEFFIFFFCEREEFTFCFYRWFFFEKEGGVLYVDIPG